MGYKRNHEIFTDYRNAYLLASKYRITFSQSEKVLVIL